MNRPLWGAISTSMLVGLLLITFGLPVWAIPVMPASYWGTVKTSAGANGPAGAVVAAWIQGTQVVSTTTIASGGETYYMLDVPGDDLETPADEGAVANDNITFTVDGVPVPETGIWVSGSSTRLDLVVPVSTPTLTEVSPNAGAQGQTMTLEILGQNTQFATGNTSVQLGAGITVQRVQVQSPTRLTVEVAIASTAATGPRTLQVTVGAATLQLADAFTVLGPGLELHLPWLTAPVGSEFTVPITVPNVSSFNIGAVQADLAYDPQVLTLVGADQVGTLSAGWTLMSNPTSGLLRIALYHPQQTLSGGGVLLNVRFRMTGGVSAQSSLALQNVLFNNGTPPVVAHAGGVTSSAYQVAGVVRYQGSVRAVSGVTVTVSGATATSLTSGADGRYALAVDAPGTLTLTPAKRGGGNIGVSELDAAYVARCVVGLLSGDVCALARADADGDGRLTAYDARAVARFALGLSTTNLPVGDWLFVPPMRQFTLSGNHPNHDFEAQVIGDLTADWGVTEVLGASTAAALELLPLSYSADGTTVTATLQLEAAGDDVYAFRVGLVYDPAALDLLATSATQAGWVTLERDETGQVTLVAYGERPLLLPGAIAQISFAATSGNVGEGARLISARLNEGGPAVTLVGLPPTSQHTIFMPVTVR